MFTIDLNSGQRYGWDKNEKFLPYAIQLQANPKQPGEFFLRDNTTTDIPPDPAAGECVLRDMENSTWVTKQDPTQKFWYKKTDGSQFKPHSPLWENDGTYTDTERTDPESEWNETVGDWVLPRAILEDRAINKVLVEFNTRIATVKSGYTQEEIDSWAKQEVEAREYIADPVNATVPLISGIAQERGYALADFADLIVQKANYYAGIVGPLIGRKKVMVDALAGKTDAQLQEYNAATEWDTP